MTEGKSAGVQPKLEALTDGAAFDFEESPFWVEASNGSQPFQIDDHGARIGLCATAHPTARSEGNDGCLGSRT
jgi:hypothetical protein